MENYTEKPYKLAIRWHWLTKYYDFLVANLMREKRFKGLLVKQFHNQNPQNILDIGCGTATLTILMQKHYPKAQMTGLDGDESILAIAQKKMKQENFAFEFVKAMSYSMPFAENTFDVATSSIMLHHLSDSDKIKTLTEAHRVLKPNGEINIADWGKASNFMMRTLFHIIQLLDGYDTTTSNVQGRIPEFMQKAGFRDVKEVSKINTVLGTVSLYQGLK